MAPEVLLNAYNHKADIFSFGVLLWELFHVAIPFLGLSGEQVVLRVQMGYRAKISLSGRLVSLSALISMMWHQDTARRPEISSVVAMLLEMDIETLEQIDIILDSSQKSVSNEGSLLVTPSSYGNRPQGQEGTTKLVNAENVDYVPHQL